MVYNLVSEVTKMEVNMVNIINREIQKNIEKVLFKGKIVIIYGARQTGKTTLVKQIAKKYTSVEYLNCDEPDIRESLTGKTSTQLKNIIGSKKLVIIDEAQRVADIGITLKLLVDNFPEIQIIATGSSSFELSNKIVEPLTGRKYEFWIYPFSLRELSSLYSLREIERMIEQRVIYGMYPEIVLSSVKEAEEKLRLITRSYLYKDILSFDKIKNSENIIKLVKALALQIGQEVSYNELANLIGISKNTIKSYIQILEQAFIIFRLPPYSKNLRTEIRKKQKIYFWDTGVRNALINNFNSFELRQDTGSLWENFIISERLKYLKNMGDERNIYFWRQQKGREIDLIEEKADNIFAYEIKWGKSKFTFPQAFQVSYPKAQFDIITKENFLSFLGLKKLL